MHTLSEGYVVRKWENIFGITNGVIGIGPRNRILFKAVEYVRLES